MVTTPTRADAERIGAALVQRRLAACAQVSGPIHSTFRWQGRVETAQEWICTLKSASEQLAQIERLLAELHPYEVPELIATPIVTGGEAYLKWLAEQLTN
jgi:periplasmic divalent cation tolerance protein